jgi:hypothetical protein
VTVPVGSSRRTAQSSAEPDPASNRYPALREFRAERVCVINVPFRNVPRRSRPKIEGVSLP